MSSEIVLKVENVGKRYEIYEAPHHRLFQTLWRGRKQFYKEFWALKDVSFEVKKGECLGIIGRNGCGKSTLLQIIAGTLAPTTGSVSVTGKVAALLELGSGFNPEFTGRENVYMNGAIMGLSRAEMDKKFDEIAAFADIGEFIEQPVKIYSSGMYVRLAFATTINFDPEIMVVDEALSVGDAYFQAKCYERIAAYKKKGNTLLLVTHSMGDVVKHCDRALFLRAGCVAIDGSARDATNLYMDELFGKKPANSNVDNKSETPTAEFLKGSNESFHSHPGYRKEEYRWGNGGARILDYLVRANGQDYPPVINSNERAEFYFKVRFDRDYTDLTPGFLIKTHDGIFLYGTNSFLAGEGKKTITAKAGQVMVFQFLLPVSLNAGHYLVSFGISSGPQELLEPLDRRYDSVLITVERSVGFWGMVDLNAQFSFTGGKTIEKQSNE